MFRLIAFIASLAAAHVACAGTASAQAYPTRPVTIVVPFAAGGGNDILARLIAQHMGRALGQQFVIENRAGAGGTLGARAVAKAPPDGHTLMVGHSGVFGVAPALYADPGYEPRRDFAPIGLIASYQQVLVVHPSMAVRSVADLIGLARKDPSKIAYATAGVGSGSHLSTELFAAMADIKLTHVPYRGTGAMQGDLVGGHVDMSITTFPSVFGQLRSGGLRPIAVTGDKRSAILADLPTVAESGVPGYAAVIHYGMVAPAGTSRAIVERLNAELRAALASREVRERIAEEGGEALPGTPEQQALDLGDEEAKWGALVRKLGIRSE
ncbi:MAG TPA: tripartite tricarboxylate transporter substrate binding protein [Xanthobacteraceae bacterium]